MPAPFKWTDEQIEDMTASYERSESVRSIAARYGTSHQVIGPLLKKHSVLLRPNYEAIRRHTCDYAYFRTIDTEEKAYWLGFLTADGCVTTGNRVAVHLASVDCVHLFKLKMALHATQVVSENIRSCSFVICSLEMAADLARHGILPNKTFYTKTAQVAPLLARHYWRGVLDGDGSFSRDGSELKLVGDYDVVLGFRAFVSSRCPNVKANIQRKENIFAFVLRKQVALLILRVLYEDAAVFLDRKFEAAKRIIQLT
jgi:hypothetical protein